MPDLTLIESPSHLPDPPASGRVVLVDIAFAYKTFDTVTEPLIKGLGERLAGWIDHHDHPAWEKYGSDPRFVLVGKKQAPGCPQLISPELVGKLGEIDHLWAHADFDGCMTAAKMLCGGKEPYPGADEDARAIDYPNQGYECSDKGMRLARAMDQASNVDQELFLKLCRDLVFALTMGLESEELAEQIDSLQQDRIKQEAWLATLPNQATQPHPEILLLRLEKSISSADKKWLLRALQKKATVGVVYEGNWTTAATTRVEGKNALDLNTVEGLTGQAGYASGGMAPEAVIAGIAALLEQSKK